MEKETLAEAKMKEIEENQAKSHALLDQLKASLALQRLVPDVFKGDALFPRAKAKFKLAKGASCYLAKGASCYRRNNFTLIVTRSDGTEVTFPGKDVPDVFWEQSAHEDIRNARP